MPDTQLDADLLLSNGLIYDGSSLPPRPGSVAVLDGRIAAIGDGLNCPGAETIDLGGLALAPGFIDAHTHDDRIVIDEPDMTPKISQGVTTVVTGNCGISIAPITMQAPPPPPMNLLGSTDAYAFPSFRAYAETIGNSPPAVNVVALIGHSTLRLATMGDVHREASADEIIAMRALAARAMAEGASGFSTGLFYPTNIAATPSEVSAVGEMFAAGQGIYATHMRDETEHVLDSIAESLDTARQARLPLVISHHKCAGPANWGRSVETLPALELAARNGAVNYDVYPYAAGSTVLRSDLVTSDYRIMITWSNMHPETGGRDLADIAAGWGVSLLEAADRLQPAGAIYFQMDETDVRRIMAHGLAMIGSDGLPHDAHPHPRLWGTFPRVIGHYARELGLFSIATAVHKMTGLTARVFGLSDRGRIAEGFAADLVVFDPERIIDRATYERPNEMAEGVERVYVNGKLSFHGGRRTSEFAGKLLQGRRPPAPATAM